MNVIKWQDIYEVHVEAIDEQHKKLVGLVNQMADAMRVGKGKAVVGEVLKELVEYTAYHFQTEEGIYREQGWTELERHKKMHDELTAKAKELKKNFDRGKGVITTEVLLFLSSWLNKHIVEEDKKFGRFLEEQRDRSRAS